MFRAFTVKKDAAQLYHPYIDEGEEAELLFCHKADDPRNCSHCNGDIITEPEVRKI